MVFGLTNITSLRSFITFHFARVYAINEGSVTPLLSPHSHYDAPCLYMVYIGGMNAETRLA